MSVRPSNVEQTSKRFNLRRRLCLAAAALVGGSIAFQVANSGGESAPELEPAVHTETLAFLGSSNTRAIKKNKGKRYGVSQQQTFQDVIGNLRQYHYRDLKLDDNFSKNFFDAYLEDLDPGRQIFLKGDIDTFSKFQSSFDEMFRKGDLSIPYQIYDVYKSRLTQNLQRQIDRLDDSALKLTFTSSEFVETDRENSPWPKTIGELEKLWEKRADLGVLNLVLAGKEEKEARETVVKRYKNQLRRIEQQQDDDVYEIFVNAVTGLYGPHTNYLGPRESENFDIQMRLSLEGIGAVLQSEDEYVKVVRLVFGGPAQKQGQLKASDRIIGVAQGATGEMVDVVGWRLDEVVDLIRGDKGSTVVLNVLGANSAADEVAQKVRIVRDEVKLEDQAAKKAVIEVDGVKGKQKIGVINLPAFYSDFRGYQSRDPEYRSSTRDVAKLIKELQQEGVEGLVLDLRNNGGGSLREATQLTDLFIERGPVVQIRSASRRVDTSQRAKRPPLYNGPLVVLINRLSASASEIFAGAIQDYGRGVIVGSQSFGKGTVQTLGDLKFGKIKLTQSTFYRVSGDSTQHRGVLPDITMPDLFLKDEVGESTYDGALPWTQIPKARYKPVGSVKPYIPILSSNSDTRKAKDPDIQYLIDRRELNKSNQKRTQVSLNKAKRLEERDRRQLESMTIENRRRVAEGEMPLKDLSAYRKWLDDEEERLKEEENARNAKVSDPSQIPLDVKDDAVLAETSRIAADFARLLADQNRRSLASRKGQ